MGQHGVTQGAGVVAVLRCGAGHSTRASVSGPVAGQPSVHARARVATGPPRHQDR